MTTRTIGKYEIVREMEFENYTLMIVRIGKYYACVDWNPDNGQFGSANYGGSGSWVASGWRESALDYVADLVSRSTAYRRFAEAVELSEE